MKSKPRVTVFGAYGHTARFVVAELCRRGFAPILSGRDRNKLGEVEAAHRGLEVRPASVDSPSSLDDALAGARAVINCAGPFARTAEAVMEAALRARIPYLDIAAEIEVAMAAFDRFADRALESGIAIIPAMAFYGGLGDLLATAAMDDWSSADEINIAYALSSWRPTLGTRATIQVSRDRRGGRRVVWANDSVELRTDAAPIVSWTFPEPVGVQPVFGEFTTADSVTIRRHLKAGVVSTYMTVTAVKDLLDPDPSPPAKTDERGRSSQTFLVEVVARSGSVKRRAVARGRDIYAISAPLVIEATERLLRGVQTITGVVAAGEIFDARDFLLSLSPEHLAIEFEA